MVGSLEWPENDDAPDERDRFDARVVELIGEADYVAFVPVPAPGVQAEGRVAEDGRLELLALPYEGVAWLCPAGAVQAALRPVFAARVPELSIIAFRAKPSARDVVAALNAPDGKPAERVLFFDDGELIAIRSA